MFCILSTSACAYGGGRVGRRWAHVQDGRTDGSPDAERGCFCECGGQEAPEEEREGNISRCRWGAERVAAHTPQGTALPGEAGAVWILQRSQGHGGALAAEGAGKERGHQGGP